ncbi:MAG: NAD(P)/FAD-dependent oxidoreductase [Burkholderiales bacterium]|nr:NAD(P)/FAD-dependent oxidoreductase [Burkholderiales bacterium]
MLYDVGIVGAGFAGLACARVAARRGLRVLVVDRKAGPGERMHTTGLVVKEAAERWEIPAVLTRRVPGIRLYAPRLSALDLDAAGYYFLATDTPALMRWFTREAARAGAHLRFGRAFGAQRIAGGWRFDRGERVRWLVGADGPRSAVAAHAGLGRNRHFLAGVEAEYRGVEGVDPDRLHCFLDRTLARGYIGWVVPGHGGVFQIGLACRRPQRPNLRAFLRKVAPVFDFAHAQCIGHRGGLIPVGGPVSPMSAGHVLLVGDAAGLVSPLSAGGIHTALESGFVAAHAIADHLLEGASDPGRAVVQHAPRFVTKRALRVLYDRGVPDAWFDAMLGTRAFTALARSVYFHHRGLRSVEGWRDLAQALLRGHP